MRGARRVEQGRGHIEVADARRPAATS
jgi:hypothetical protein